MSNHHKVFLALCAALALTACSSANKDWARASAENTIAGYQSFVDKHASDPRINDAKAYILALQDDAAWKTAQSGNSVDSYQQYLQTEPNGTHAQAARDLILGIERGEAWKTAKADGSATAIDAFLQKYSHGPEADQARQALAGLRSSYRAELGAFHSEHAAERKRSELQSRYSNVLKEVDVLSPDSSNKRYRVMSGMMDRDEAASTCASLKRDHQDCEVVKADQQQS